MKKLTPEQTAKRMRTNKRIFLFGFLPLAVIILIVMIAGDDSTKKEIDNLTPAQKLLTLDSLNSIDTTSVIYRHEKYLIDGLAARYHTSPDSIAEWVSRAKSVYEERVGIVEKSSDLLEGVNNMGPIPAQNNGKFGDAITLLLMGIGASNN